MEVWSFPWIKRAELTAGVPSHPLLRRAERRRTGGTAGERRERVGQGQGQGRGVPQHPQIPLGFPSTPRSPPGSHHGSWIGIFLPELQGQVRHSLCHTLHRHRLVVGEPVILQENPNKDSHYPHGPKIRRSCVAEVERCPVWTQR